MQHVRRSWTRLAVTLALLCGALLLVPAPAQAVDNPCGATSPTTGSVTTYKSGSSDYNSVTFRFTLTQAQLNNLRCSGPYLELDFQIRNFKNTAVYPAGWEAYTVAGTNLPGAIHDVGFEDGQAWPSQSTENRDINPAVTRIYTSQLQAGVSYYANLTWTLEAQAGKIPYITFVWTPSRWADMSAMNESVSCAGGSFGNNQYPPGDSRNPNEAWCIFPTDYGVTLLGDKTFLGGFPAGQIPLPTGQYWFSFEPGSPSDANTPPPPTPARIGVLDTNRTFSIKEGAVTNTWMNLTTGDKIQLSPNRVGVLQGDVLSVKQGALTSFWTQETDGVTDFRVTDNRIAVLKGSNLYIKEGALDSTNWVLLATGVSSFDMSPNRIAIVQGGQVSVKEGAITANWLPLTNNVNLVKVTDNRVAVLQGTTLSAKEGSLTGGWLTLVYGADTFDLSPNRVAIIASGNLSVKEGALTSGWTYLTNGASAVQLTDSRVGVLQGSAVSVKEGALNGSWAQLTTGGSSAFDLS
jgi:hypothetical protein